MFQSSPPSQGGRYAVRRLCPKRWRRVSILAPLARGALHLAGRRVCDRDVCFNPRPPRKGGATPLPPPRPPSALVFQSSPPSQGGRYGGYSEKCATQPKFQSSPPSQGGRYTRPTTRDRADRGFNPRPPRKGGATRPNSRPRLEMVVSILAPLARGALLCSTTNRLFMTLFQSSPPSQGGRYFQLIHPRRFLPCFNPRPPRKGGATVNVSI